MSKLALSRAFRTFFLLAGSPVVIGVGASACFAPADTDEPIAQVSQPAPVAPGKEDCFPKCKDRIPPKSDAKPPVDNCKALSDLLVANNKPKWTAGAPVCIGLSEDIDNYITNNTKDGKAPCNRLGLPSDDKAAEAVKWTWCRNQLLMECLIEGHASFGKPIFVTKPPIPKERGVTAAEACLWSQCKGKPWTAVDNPKKSPTASLDGAGGGGLIAATADEALYVAALTDETTIEALEAAADPEVSACPEEEEQDLYCSLPDNPPEDGPVTPGADGFDRTGGNEGGGVCPCVDGTCPVDDDDDDDEEDPVIVEDPVITDDAEVLADPGVAPDTMVAAPGDPTPAATSTAD